MSLNQILKNDITTKERLIGLGYSDIFQYFSDYRIFKKDIYLLLLKEDIKDRERVYIQYILTTNKEVSKWSKKGLVI